MGTCSLWEHLIGSSADKAPLQSLPIIILIRQSSVRTCCVNFINSSHLCGAIDIACIKGVTLPGKQFPHVYGLAWLPAGTEKGLQ